MNTTEPESAAKRDNSEQIGSPRRELFTDGVTILLITAGAYVGAYVYEFSYMSFFGVPPEMIEVSASTLVATGGWLVILSVVAAQLLHAVWNIDRMGFFQPTNGWGLFVKKWGMVIAVWALGFWLFRHSWLSYLNLALFLVLPIADLVVPIFARTPGQTYNQRLASWLNEPDNPKPDQLTIFKKGMSVFILNTLMWIALFSGACSLLGRLLAKTTNEFGFVEAHSENVILRKYGDRYLLARYDWDRRIFLRQFRLLPVEEIKVPVVVKKLPTSVAVVAELDNGSVESK